MRGSNAAMRHLLTHSLLMGLLFLLCPPMTRAGTDSGLCGLPSGIGARWTYICADSTGRIIDTLQIVTVGGSIASDSISTDIWELRYSRPTSRPFPIDTDTVFAGRNGSRLLLQGQNQCCAFLELDWPPLIGARELPGDTTRIDSVWVASVEEVTVPAGTFPGCARVIIRERLDDRRELIQLWISPQSGIVRMERAPVDAGGVVRAWQLIDTYRPAKTD